MSFRDRLERLILEGADVENISLADITPADLTPSATTAVVEREIINSISLLQHDKPVSPGQLSTFFNFCELFCLYDKFSLAESTSFTQTALDTPVRFLALEGILNIDVTFLSESSFEKSFVPVDIANSGGLTAMGGALNLRKAARENDPLKTLIDNAAHMYERAREQGLDRSSGSGASVPPNGKPLVITKSSDSIKVPLADIRYLKTVGNFFTGEEGKVPDGDSDIAQLVSRQLTDVIFGMGYEYLLGCHYQPSVDTSHTFLRALQPERRQAEYLCALKAYELLRKRHREITQARSDYGWIDRFQIPPIVLMLLDKVDERANMLNELFELRKEFASIRKLFKEFQDLAQDEGVPHDKWIKQKKSLETALAAVANRYGPPDMRIHDLATDSVDIVKWDDLDDGISADDISLKGLVKFFMKKPIDYLFQKIKARKLKTFYTMAEKSVRIPDRADKLARLFGISWDSEYHTAMKYAAAPVDYVVIVNEKASDILDSE